jgi:[NiFe] hydrogenase diaphorase moiety small subunit
MTDNKDGHSGNEKAASHGDDTSEPFSITVDGRLIPATAGQSVMDACDQANVYIPRLCDHEGLVAQGSCRVCSVRINGRIVAACTQPAMPDMVIDNETDDLNRHRKSLVEMLFHEGNHLCPVCEASGRCELQAMAYRLGMAQASPYPYLQPVRPVDASHPHIALDNNRCILCGRCIRASRDIDHKHVFEYVGRGIHKRIGVNAANLAATNASLDDEAIRRGTCPVGCIIRKHEGFDRPVGQRLYDHLPIGSLDEGDTP